MTYQRQAYDDKPSPISQATTVWAQGQEVVPYAVDFIPPNSFLLPGVGGGTGTGTGSGSGTGSSAQVPDPYDLHWVAGDTASFDFYFDGVCWTDVQPADTLGLTWVQSLWEAQVRQGMWYYWGYWWPPTWPGYRYLMSFTVTAVFMDDYNGLGPGTMVTLNGGTIWPGDFVWDLQTTQTPDPVAAPTVSEVRTWLSGKAKVDPQVTQQDAWPPSNWHVYTMAWE